MYFTLCLFEPVSSSDKAIHSLAIDRVYSILIFINYEINIIIFMLVASE